MRTGRSKRIWWVAGAFTLCVLGALLFVVLYRPGEPRLEGRPLSYWLGQLEPTVITHTHSIKNWPSHKFRDQAAVMSWISHSTQVHDHSSRVLRTAGPECLPMLLARLTAKPTRIESGFLRRCAYYIWLSDSLPMEEYNDREIRRGQALTAMILLGEGAAPLVPQLAILAAEDKDDAVHRAASHALFMLAPDEFRRVRAKR